MPKPTIQNSTDPAQPGLLPSAAQGGPPTSQFRDELACASSLVFPLGRGAHGKTFWTRWLIEELRNGGTDVTVVDADRTNATLSEFFPDVLTPLSAEDADVEDCLRSLTEGMMERPRTAVMDFGANDLTLKRVSRKLGGFDAYLAAGLVRGVAVHFFGPDRDDLAYLRDMENGVFAPPATLLVLNEALLPEGASNRLFDPVIDDPIFRAAVSRGAMPVFMPRLEVAREVNRRRLGFAAAAAGTPGPDGTRIGPWNRSLINAWRATMAANHQPVMEWFR
jgi:hypothetical protein